jgi:hypothetical protein
MHTRVSSLVGVDVLLPQLGLTQAVECVAAQRLLKNPKGLRQGAYGAAGLAHRLHLRRQGPPPGRSRQGGRGRAGALEAIKKAGGGLGEAYPEQVEGRRPQRGAYSTPAPRTCSRSLGSNVTARSPGGAGSWADAFRLESQGSRTDVGRLAPLAPAPSPSLGLRHSSCQWCHDVRRFCAEHFAAETEAAMAGNVPAHRPSAKFGYRSAIRIRCPPCGVAVGAVQGWRESDITILAGDVTHLVLPDQDISRPHWVHSPRPGRCRRQGGASVLKKPCADEASLMRRIGPRFVGGETT